MFVEVLDVGAGRERLASCTSNHNATHSIATLQSGKYFGEL